MFTRLIFAAYFLEAGAVLICAPWSRYWDHNAIAWVMPAAVSWLASPYLRGAVTGVGVITACAGLIELAGAFGLRRVVQEPDGPRVE